MHSSVATNKRIGTESRVDDAKPLEIATGVVSTEDSSSPIKTGREYYDDKKRSIMSFSQSLWESWNSRQDFCKAQMHVAGILVVALIGNNWPVSYPRNDNENANMFWVMCAAILIAAIATIKHDPNASSRGVQVLSRNQTEEWKGLMQWVFIMYHYYRARFVYNEIRVFVSSYVFLTGWGNWQYFSKKQDFSLERAVSMWLRINYFPLLLCLVVRTKLDDFYIVPLHTTGFFVTMATAYLAKVLEPKIKNTPKRNLAAIGISLLVHVLFYETPAVNFLKIFSEEIFFRFQADKYSTWVGILAGFLWTYVKEAAQFYNTSPPATQHQRIVSGVQISVGICFFAFWYGLFGSIKDKFVYNPIHPYVFWIPLVGWLLIRNSSKYATELHSHALEFFGRITLETYVLQFHLFMCHHVQHIPVVVPGAGPNGFFVLKTLNMLLTGALFVATAYYARQGTVTTQLAVADLMKVLRQKYETGEWPTVKAASDDSNSPEKGEIVAPLIPIKENGEEQHHRKGVQSAEV